MTTTSTGALGAFGERIAAQHLVATGMVLLDQNWRCPAGELDLVLRDRDTLVVCEVKTRASTAYGHPLESVTPAKAERLRRLALLWAEAHGLAGVPVRIDLVGVLRGRQGPAQVEHVVGVG